VGIYNKKIMSLLNLGKTVVIKAIDSIANQHFRPWWSKRGRKTKDSTKKTLLNKTSVQTGGLEEV
jgi:outer membrane receptor for monomeric catechols